MSLRGSEATEAIPGYIKNTGLPACRQAGFAALAMTRSKKNKNKIIARISVVLYLLTFSFCVVSSAHAQLVPCGIGAGNADCTLCHLVLGFKNIYDYLFEILLVCTTIVIVAAGVMYMVSSGSKGLIEKAKSAFTYALTAMILALVAWLIINTTLHALGYKNVGNWWTFTCDTTQSKNAGTLGAGGATLPPAGQTGKGGGISGKGSQINVPQDGSKLAQVLQNEKGAVYVWGGDPNSRNTAGNLTTDCSGFVKTVYKETFGVNLPRQSGQQTNQPFNYSQIIDGTILGSNGHVGVYYNGSVYHNSGDKKDVKAVELGQYLSNHNVTSMRLPPA